ncbi:MAG: RNA-binding protein [Kiritimatiellae bacterium]|nr:RNA-binding protein [Kiritimatiellia bacterium]
MTGGSGDCVEIYVGNLSYDMNEAHMRKEFERYGVVKSARIISNRFNHKSKGFGFVEMPNRPEAEAAIKALHDKDILGRKLRVNEAKNKSRE